jgi:serine/threonine protein kinase
MTTPAACPRCGAPLATNAAPDEPCPSCLLHLVLAEGPADEAETTEPLESGEGPRCRLLNVLGRGARGGTYLAETQEDSPFPRYVVLKLLDAQISAPGAARHLRARREQVAALADPAFAQILDAGLTAGRRPYFMFEYVRGLPLATYCRRPGVGNEARLALARDLSRALERAHRAGIVHGALTTSNVLLITMKDAAVPKILDLGVRQALASLDGTGMPEITAEADRLDLTRLLQTVVGV